MAIYNIPVTWSGSGAIRTGQITYSVPSKGNVITGTWGKIIGSGYTANNGMQSWNWIEMKSILTQGSVNKNITYKLTGKFYPSKTYSFELDYSEPLGSAPFSVRVEDMQKMFEIINLPSTITLNITSVTAENPYSFSCTTKEIYKNIIINFMLQSSNNVDYVVKQDDVTVASGTNVSTKSITIAAGKLKTTNSLSIQVRSRFTFEGTTYYSEWVNYSVSGLITLQPVQIDNLRYVGSTQVIEESMLISWDNVGTSAGTTKATLEVWQDGVKLHSGTFTGAQYTIPESTLKNRNSATVKVWNTSTYGTYTTTSSIETITLSALTSIAPNLIDFTLNSTNRDYDITVIPICEDVDKYRINGLSGLVIPKGTLNNGTNRITLEAIKLTSDNREIVSTLAKTITITQDMPEIYALEPDRVNVNIDVYVPITFTVNGFCSRWELIINGVSIIRGTTDRKHIAAAKTLNRGTNTLKLISYYTAPCGGGERSVTKEVNFNGYGKPKAPVLEPLSTYNTATPLYKWQDGTQESDNQVSFNLQVCKNNTLLEEKTSDVSVCEYLAQVSLENNTGYILKVRVKNKFNVWSDYAEKVFETSFNELPKPQLRVDANKDMALITITGDVPQNFVECRIYRKSLHEKDYVQIGHKLPLNESVADYTLPCNTIVSYKARIYDSTGSYSESDVVTTKCYVQNYTLANVEDLEDNFVLNLASASYQYTSNEVVKHFKNARDPVVFSDNSKSISVSITAEMRDSELFAFEQFLERARVLCFRDRRGRKYYVYAKINDAKPINATNQQITMSLVKVNFIETNMYCTDGFKRLVFLNGEYFLDGSLDLSGFEV